MIDWVTMLENLANSLVQVLNLAFGFCYVIGVGLIIGGLIGLKIFGAGRMMSQEKKHEGFLKIAVGVLFLFLPTTLNVMTTSFFGPGQVLSYNPQPGRDLYSAIKVLMQVAGVIWFARGSLMLLHVSDPGKHETYSSLMYIFAGICALNLDYLTDTLTNLLNKIMTVL